MNAEQKIFFGIILVAITGLVLLFIKMNIVFLILLWWGAIWVTGGMIKLMTKGFS